MKNSSEYRKWQRDLIYLTHTYDIPSVNDSTIPSDIIAQILRSAASVPLKTEKILGQQTSSSMAIFLKTTADSLIKIHKLMTFSLDMKLISIDEYHSISESLSELGDVVKKLINTINLNQKDAVKKTLPEPAGGAYWILN